MSSSKDDFTLFIYWVLIMCGIGLCMLPAQKYLIEESEEWKTAYSLEVNFN